MAETGGEGVRLGRASRGGARASLGLTVEDLTIEELSPAVVQRICAQSCGKVPSMDPLRKDDIERMRRMPPDERMRAVFVTVNAGVRIRLATLRAKRPHASERELEALLREWLMQDGDAVTFELNL